MSVQVETGSTAGPASYATGGMVITTTLSTVNFFMVNLEVADADLSSYRPVFTRNSPGAGQVTVKLMRKRYDKLTAIGNMSGLPSGVTARSTNGGTYDAVSHLHTINHDHGAVTSATPTTGGVGVNTVLGSGNYSTHTHSFDVPAFTGNSGSEAAHTHTWNNMYEHQHATTNTATTATLSELPNATDISGATFTWYGVK